MEDVEDIVSEDCKFEVIVQLTTPIDPSDNPAEVGQVFFDLPKKEFKFDTTWFSSHFHTLGQLWEKQRSILNSTLTTVMFDSFSSAITFNRPGLWLKKKYRLIDNQLIAAKNKQKKLLNS